MLADAGTGQLFVFALAESDSFHGAQLVGEELELVLRRSNRTAGPSDAISYLRKLAAGVATRAKLKTLAKAEGRK